LYILSDNVDILPQLVDTFEVKTKMTALKHGLYRIGLMLCDRCTTNAGCEQFSPDSVCTIEKEAYEQLVKELTKHYKLDMVADRILAERAAMYLIKISRVETHEAASGVTQKSLFLGNYITRLDNTLRGFLNDLAVSRLKRKNLEKTEQLMVNMEDILERLATRPMPSQKQRRTAGGATYTDIPFMTVQHLPPNIIEHQTILNEWRKEMHTLRALIARKHK
jgi:hypothetical protein